MKNALTAVAVVGALALGTGLLVGCADGEAPPASRAATPAQIGEFNEHHAVATFGGGCFWGVEASFRELEGVTATEVGYAGGHVANPTYHQVCTDRTGHAEVVRIDFDPTRISYEKLLDGFWKVHDPTQLDRQGPDVGKQYRSVIFCHTPQQEAAAEASLKRQADSGRFTRPIVTRIEPLSSYYPAEDYHQQYLEKRGLASCHPSLRE